RGQECSGYWPAGTAAFHIGADIADAVIRYQAAVEDDEFECEVGNELLVETARLWRSLGHHDPQGRFRIDGVTGPDEYSAIADNNVYTNLLAQRNLIAAADMVARHPRHAAEFGADLEEAAAWRDAAQDMVIPWDEALGVHAGRDRGRGRAPRARLRLLRRGRADRLPRPRAQHARRGARGVAGGRLDHRGRRLRRHARPRRQANLRAAPPGAARAPCLS